jgi:hypothetical protein
MALNKMEMNIMAAPLSWCSPFSPDYKMQRDKEL